MYYKDFKYSDKKKEIQLNYSVEFATALFEQVKDTEKAVLALANFSMEGESYTVGYVGVNTMGKASVSAYHEEKDYKHYFKWLTATDTSSMEKFNDAIKARSDYIRSTLTEGKETKKIVAEDFNAQYLTDSLTIRSLYPQFNEEKYHEYKAMVADFCVPKAKGVIYDKDGEEYHFTITKNADSTVKNIVVIDSLNLYKGKEQVGYLHVQYSTDEVFNAANSQFAIVNKKRPTPEEKKQFLTEHKINFDEKNLDVVYRLKAKHVREKIKRDYTDMASLINIASIDYSRIKESYQKKGLGSQMYFKMAQYLKTEKLEFRGSSIQSEEALGLWSKIRKICPDEIEVKRFHDRDYLFLKGDNLDRFVNKPKKKPKLTL